jgi:hypothetical protein
MFRYICVINREFQNLYFVKLRKLSKLKLLKLQFLKIIELWIVQNLYGKAFVLFLRYHHYIFKVPSYFSLKFSVKFSNWNELNINYLWNHKDLPQQWKEIIILPIFKNSMIILPVVF